MSPKPRKSNVSTHARAKRSKEALRAALLRLLKRKPFAQVTVRDIAVAANVDYTTFFRHYPGKEALLDDLATDEMAHLVAKSLSVLDSTDKRSACIAVCAYVHQKRKLWSALLTGGAASALREELMRQSVRSAETRASTKGRIPLDIATTIVVSGIFEILAWWLRQSDPLPVERAAEILYCLVIAPLSIPEPRPRRTKSAERAD